MFEIDRESDDDILRQIFHDPVYVWVVVFVEVVLYALLVLYGNRGIYFGLHFWSLVAEKTI